MNLIKWICVVPFSLILSAIFLGVVSKILALLTFDVAFLEGIALYAIYGSMPALGCFLGIKIAPSKNNVAKWLALLPFILWSVFSLVTLVMVFLSSSAPTEPSTLLEGYDGLSVKWQLVWVNCGLIVGTIWAGTRTIKQYTD